LVAGGDAVPAVVLEVRQERAYPFGGEVIEGEAGDAPAGLGGGEGQEQPQAVAVTVDGAGAHAALELEVLFDVPVEGGAEVVHGAGNVARVAA